MSRKVLVVAALAALIVPVATLHAQVGFGVAGGFSQPLGDFKKIAESGYHITGLVNLSVPLAPAGFRLEGSFSEYEYKRIVTTGSTSKARVLYATANGIVSTPGLLGPYVIGGVGVYRSTAECTSCSTSSTKFGFNGGGGFKVGLAGLAVFAEARFHYVPGASDPTTAGIKSSTQFIPVSVGITF